MNKYHTLLELNKIIETLKDFVILKNNRDQLEDLELMNDIEEINKSLNEVDEAAVLIQRMGRFPLYFRGDIGYFLSLIHKSGMITEIDLAEIGKFLDTVKSNQIYLDSLESNKIPCSLYKEYFLRMQYPKELNLRIKEIVNQYGEIQDTASIKLREIRKSIREMEKTIQSKLQEMLAKNASKLTSATISLRNDRYVIPVKSDFKNAIPGIIHDQSASRETVFIEPLAIFEINNKLNSLHEEEKDEIVAILRQICSEIDDEYDDLREDLEILVHLDMAFGKADYALSIKAKKPRINDQGIVDLLNARHPLLKVEKIIPNNISIGRDYQGIIITGPNTGGKTVVLKTVGLLALMVKMGMLIPCDENSDMMIFDNVFADIGDEQSISQNLSTFSSHIRNVIDIINQVTPHSLVLLDELGSGTDPVEGSSLAISIFDHLLAKQCLIIATSHYPELKIHAYDSERIINASVEFDSETLKPTYKLLLGIPGQSNALNISRHLGLPETILQQSEKYVGQKDTDLNKIINKLIKQTTELDVKLEAVNQKNQELEGKLRDIDLERVRLVRERNQVMKTAEEEARKIIGTATKKMDAVLDELNEMKLREVKIHEIAQIKYQVKEIKDEAKIVIETIPDDQELLPNSQVFVENYDCYGTVIKKTKKDKYDVQIGNAQISVDRKFLRRTNQPAAEPTQKSTIEVSVKKNVSPTLDLRGFRYEEASDRLEKFLDDAVYAGLHQVSIIHGFGTGVIREMVINFLKTSAHVESFRFGGAGEGGMGATVATLK